MKKLIVLSAIMIAFVGAASAQQLADRGIHRSVREGVRNGKITHGERKDIAKNQVRYHHMAHKAKRDGHVSRHERRRLHKMKMHNRHDVFRYKHNGKNRGRH